MSAMGVRGRLHFDQRNRKAEVSQPMSAGGGVGLPYADYGFAVRRHRALTIRADCKSSGTEDWFYYYISGRIAVADASIRRWRHQA